MRITSISTHSSQLTRFGFINCYLVREADGFTLIDTTMAGAASKILGVAETLGAPIRRVVLTHAHGDHIGSVDALLDSRPKRSLVASERSKPLLQRPVDKRLQADEPRKEFFGGLPGILSKVTETVGDNEVLGSLRCIATPGHLPGHVSFLDERDGTLFAGDALVAVGRLSVSGWTPWYFPLPEFVMWSKPLALASAQRLMDYPIERFACGHGPVRDGGIPALRQAVDRAG